MVKKVIILLSLNMSFSALFCMENNEQLINGEQLVAYAVQLFNETPASRLDGHLVKCDASSGSTGNVSESGQSVPVQAISNDYEESHKPTKYIRKKSRKKNSYSSDDSDYACSDQDDDETESEYEEDESSPSRFDGHLERYDVSSDFAGNVSESGQSAPVQAVVPSLPGSSYDLPSLACGDGYKPCENIIRLTHREAQEINGKIKYFKFKFICCCGKIFLGYEKLIEHLKESSDCFNKICCEKCKQLDYKVFNQHLRNKVFSGKRLSERIESGDIEIEDNSEREYYPHGYIENIKDGDCKGRWVLRPVCNPNLAILGASTILAHLNQCAVCKGNLGCDSCRCALSNFKVFKSHIAKIIVTLNQSVESQSDNLEQPALGTTNTNIFPCYLVTKIPGAKATQAHDFTCPACGYKTNTLSSVIRHYSDSKKCMMNLGCQECRSYANKLELDPAGKEKTPQAFMAHVRRKTEKRKAEKSENCIKRVKGS